MNKALKTIVVITVGAVVMVGVVLLVVQSLNFASGANSLYLLEGTQNALPSKVLDRNGELITLFYSEEHREPIEFQQIPNHLIYALLTREDRTFFRHRGFSVRGTARAVWNLITGNYISGGSTLTQQLAGYLFADRSEFSISRKVRELWWALQMEKYWSKNQILEKYLNTMFFGHGAYGIEAAAKFYFGHSARDLTLAQSAMLVIQLANPSRYSPIRNPNQARTIQRRVLDQMVELGYIEAEEATQSFEDFWRTYDYTRSNRSAAFFERDDKAPYFTEYIRYQLENEYLLGGADINRDGFVIHTTLDLNHQRAADTLMQRGISSANRIYLAHSTTSNSVSRELIDLTEMIKLAFGIQGVDSSGDGPRRVALKYYLQNITGILDIASLMFGVDESDPLRVASQQTQSLLLENEQRTTVEGALISIENGSGHILAMVGGSKFESRNQFNRATNARVEPGSAFKPLYYAAGIEKRAITPATLIYDAPVVFWNDDGTPYVPQNYRGEWVGPVLARTALARSMNIPSLRVLEKVGFSDALETARLLLGIEKHEMIERNFVRRYPVGLGVVEVSPIEMARAFSTFANRGAVVEPIAIRYIEDRHGRVILEPDKEQKAHKGDKSRQIISPQTAYIMTHMLQSTTRFGTLSYAVGNADWNKNIGIAGKTGTTQNWADAWTVGYSPYYTTAVWIGFDRGGFNSLGTSQTGAVTAGPIWAQYMSRVHANLSDRSFSTPPEGVASTQVTARSGLLVPADYQGGVVEEYFIAGTAPQQYDTSVVFESSRSDLLLGRLRDNLFTTGSDSTLFNVNIGANIDTNTANNEAPNDVLDTLHNVKLNTNTANNDAPNDVLDTLRNVKLNTNTANNDAPNDVLDTLRNVKLNTNTANNDAPSIDQLFLEGDRSSDADLRYLDTLLN